MYGSCFLLTKVNNVLTLSLAGDRGKREVNRYINVSALADRDGRRQTIAYLADY